MTTGWDTYLPASYWPQRCRGPGTAVTRRQPQLLGSVGRAATVPQSGDRGDIAYCLTNPLAVTSPQRCRSSETAVTDDPALPGDDRCFAATEPQLGDRGDNPDEKDSYTAINGP
ncbi:hypothetical protein GCM10012287_56440 [Streptomyces daqingensis]|uniref:Uncharacterized protein n=1 Tax=Streptomyces daqingensis TaxID=1472640 RepID=A0ABQ2MTP4_9ACTN|nr:hypothetical protein GCM10012287_56440 [Streptomyces daqingensis]